MQQPPTQQTIAGPWLTNPDLRIWVAIVALAIIAIVATLLNRSSSDVLCQLFDDYETTRSETHLVLMALGTKGLTDYKIIDGQICVDEKFRAEYLAAIKEQDALPQIYDVQEELTPNPFLLRNQQVQQELNRKKQHVRNMVLRLPDVNEVLFEMDVIESGSPFKPDQQSAAVMVSMAKGSVLTSQHVTTIQGIVCGSFAAIEPTKVFITDANLGVSYHDLSDVEQAKLIQLVNWKKQRRQFYLEKLQELSTTFPHLEINVDVSRPDSNDSVLDFQDKVAASLPPITAPKVQTSGHLTLNGGGTIDDVETSDDQMVIDHSVVKAAYINSEPKPDIPSMQQLHAAAPEVIKIEIRVPNQVINDFKLAAENDKATKTGKFEGLKAQILAKISKIIPPHVLAASPPISIYPQLPHPTAPDARAVSMARLLQTYWPVLAVVLIGVGYFSINRTSSTTNATANAQPDLAIGNEEEQLQNQLSNLIDNDPEAAAKVIKNWIRNAA